MKLENRSGIRGNATAKWEPKLTPCFLVGVTIGPAGIWAHSYGVIPLQHFLSRGRASSTAIWRTCDVVLPEVVTFPLCQRLSMHGACQDETLPEPRVLEDGDDWALAEEKGGEAGQCDLVDGSWEENAPAFEITDSLQEVLALDPDLHEEDALCLEPPVSNIIDPEGGWYEAVHPDTVEEEKADDAIKDEVAVPQGGSPPLGWRIDKFGPRLVSVLPWSRCPPTCEPEAWVGYPLHVQRDIHEKWKNEQPDEFAEQEKRRALWLEAKKAGKVAKAVTIRSSVVEMLESREVPTDCSPRKCTSLDGMSALQAQQGPTATEFHCNSRGANELLVGMSARGTQQVPSAIDGLEPAELAKRTRELLLEGEFRCCSIELSNVTGSILSKEVPDRCLAVRFTAGEELTLRPVRREVHRILRLCWTLNVVVHVWVAMLSDALIGVAVPVCRHAASPGESYSWGWLETEPLWQDCRMQQLLKKTCAMECLIYAAAIENFYGFHAPQWHGLSSSNAACGHIMLKIMTTHPTLPDALAVYAKQPETAMGKNVTDCSDNVAAPPSASCILLTAKMIWNSLLRADYCVSAVLSIVVVLTRWLMIHQGCPSGAALLHGQSAQSLL